MSYYGFHIRLALCFKTGNTDHSRETAAVCGRLDGILAVVESFFAKENDEDGGECVEGGEDAHVCAPGDLGEKE
jgi:hypothetical protein